MTLKPTSGSTLVPTGKKAWYGAKLTLSVDELWKWLQKVKRRLKTL
jgi:hypothetical protein